MDAIDPEAKYLALRIDTPKNTPAKSTVWPVCAEGDKILEAVEILWAPGHVGLTGVRISYNGRAILPWGQDTGQVVDNDRLREFVFELYVATSLVVVTSNGDLVNAHTHYLTARLREVDRSPAAIGPQGITVL